MGCKGERRRGGGGGWREKRGIIDDFHAETRAGPNRAVLSAKDERGAESEGKFMFSALEVILDTFRTS